MDTSVRALAATLPHFRSGISSPSTTCASMVNKIAHITGSLHNPAWLIHLDGMAALNPCAPNIQILRVSVTTNDVLFSKT